jgi:subtilisin family serine protease
MSFAGSGTATPSKLDCTNGNSDALHYAICRATKLGITFVAAAGNSSIDAAGTLPAAYDEVIAVSALADSDGLPGGLGPPPSCFPGQLDDHFATFSNFGAVVDLAAPGVCILSTAMGGDYVTMSGTSMAAPHVAGAAALYIQTHPAALPAQVRSALIAAAERGPVPGDPDGFPEGIVHVSSATAPPTVPPTLLPPLPALPSLPALPPLPPLPALPGLPPLP